MSDRRSTTGQPPVHTAARESGPRPSTARGTVIAGRYLVERMLGRGGMASVYLAHDRMVNRPVALKILRRELANSAAMERFTREIGVIGRLRHAHIVPLHDSGIYEELPFYVMAYIEGESLQERLARDGPLPIADVVRFGTQAAEALAYAHREGVLHRDVTPANILIADDNAYLADFGIARLFNESSSARTTQSGFILGTPSYMSPEQASGDLELDGRSDVYSLGCVLYEMATGSPPFSGPTPQSVIAGHFGAPPPTASELRGDVPSELGDAIARAMRSDPAERFQSAAELLAALEAAAPADPARLRAGDRRGRLRRLASVAALLASAVLGAGWVARSHWSPLREQLERIAMNRARKLVARGEWARADTAWRRIVEDNPASARAHLWLAQTGALAAAASSDPDDAWKAELELAGEGRAGLDSSDRLRLAALRAYVEGANDVAARRFRALITAEPADPVARLALADSYMNDLVVERDSASPSGWRFRGSWEEAARVLRSLLDQRPRSPALRRAVHERLARVLVITNRYRAGRSADRAEGAFLGFPSLSAETLAYVPWRQADVESGVAESRNPTLAFATARNRGLLRRAAREWAEDLPDDPEAHRAHATALAAADVIVAPNADVPDAVREIRRARELASDARARLLAGAQEVRLLVRARHWGEARRLADSLIAGARPRDTEELEMVAALSALRGDARRALAFLTTSTDGWTIRLPDGRIWTVPTSVAGPWKALELHAAVGAPAGELVALRDRLDAVIRRDVAPDMVPRVRPILTMRALTLAVPVAGRDILHGLDPGSSLVARLVRDAADGDVPALRRGLGTLDRLRQTREGASVSIDGAYLFAWLRLAAADTAGAERQMDTVLESLRAVTDGSLTDVTGSALVTRLMRQRAAVAARRGEPTVARRWQSAADTLGGIAPPAPR